MRLFIAIQLPQEMRFALEEIQSQFKSQGVRGRYTRPENLHITLAFIGEYPDPQEVLEVLRSVPFKPFELRLKGIGAFDDLWWVGLEYSETLANYVRALRRALAEAGLPFNRKRFSPHITLVRRVSCDRGRLTIEVPMSGMTVDRVALMRSDRGKDGMIYTEIDA